MEGYKDRFAAVIQKEMKRRGESPRLLAEGVGVKERTVERWLEAESSPQGANLKSLSDFWRMPIEELRPDLAVETEALARIEAKLDRLLQHAGLSADFETIAGELEREIEAVDSPAGSSGSRTGGSHRASES